MSILNTKYISVVEKKSFHFHIELDDIHLQEIILKMNACILLLIFIYGIFTFYEYIGNFFLKEIRSNPVHFTAKASPNYNVFSLF